MAACIRPQNFIHVGREPLLRGGQVLKVLELRRLSNKERGLAVSPDIPRISSVDVVPTPNGEILSVLVGDYTRV